MLHELRLRLGVLEADPQSLLQPDHHRAVCVRRPLHRDHRDSSASSDQELNFNDPFFNFFANFNINTAGFIIVGAFAATWAIAVLWWHFGNVEEKWDAKMIHHEPSEASAAS